MLLVVVLRRTSDCERTGGIQRSSRLAHLSGAPLLPGAVMVAVPVGAGGPSVPVVPPGTRGFSGLAEFDWGIVAAVRPIFVLCFIFDFS